MPILHFLSSCHDYCLERKAVWDKSRIYSAITMINVIFSMIVISNSTTFYIVAQNT